MPSPRASWGSVDQPSAASVSVTGAIGTSLIAPSKTRKTMTSALRMRPAQAVPGDRSSEAEPDNGASIHHHPFPSALVSGALRRRQSSAQPGSRP